MAERKLELNKETLRSLTDADLNEVSGGIDNKITTFASPTQSPVCPSGATWLMACDTYVCE